MQAKGKDVIKQPKRDVSAAAMQEAAQNIVELRRGKAEAQAALQVRCSSCNGVHEAHI